MNDLFARVLPIQREYQGQLGLSFLPVEFTYSRKKLVHANSTDAKATHPKVTLRILDYVLGV